MGRAYDINPVGAALAAASPYFPFSAIPFGGSIPKGATVRGIRGQMNYNGPVGTTIRGRARFPIQLVSVTTGSFTTLWAGEAIADDYQNGAAGSLNVGYFARVDTVIPEAYTQIFVLLIVPDWLFIPGAGPAGFGQAYQPQISIELAGDQ